jgi:hypothetical protein
MRREEEEGKEKDKERRRRTLQTHLLDLSGKV